jgi:DNA-binding NarL/FixJ family response regulator
MRDSTRVFVLADTNAAASRLAEVFADHPDFIVSGFGLVNLNPQLNGNRLDVAVVQTTASKALLPKLEVPVLLLAAPNSTHSATRRVADAVLPLNASPAQIRVAVQALAVGLHVDATGNEAAVDTDFTFFEALTERELEILNLLGEGFTNPEIATQLAISRNTVKFHVSSIIGKLGAGSRTEAVTIAVRRGLIIV